MTRPERPSLVLPAFAAALLLTACSGTPSASPGPSESPSPSVATSASPTPTPTPEPVSSPTSEPTLSPVVSIPSGDLAFGYSDFAGFLIGSTRDDFAAGTGFPSEVCFEYGHEGFYPATGDTNNDGHVTFYDADWVIWVDSSNNQPGFDPNAYIIHQFALRAGPSVPLDTPFGPTGPSGVRLGMSDSFVTATFPQAIIRTYDYSYPFWDSPDMTYIQHIVSALNGTFMVITTVEGFVVDIHWGNTALGNGWQGTLCD